MTLNKVTRREGKRHGLLVRVIAIFFLLYTGADIASPQLCNEELVGMSGEAQAVELTPINTGSVHSNAIAAVSVAPEDSQKDQPADQPSQDEDCFCCCAHVLPGMVITNAIVFDLSTPSFVLEHVLVPSPPLGSTFRPPRFA